MLSQSRALPAATRPGQCHNLLACFLQFCKYSVIDVVVFLEGPWQKYDSLQMSQFCRLICHITVKTKLECAVWIKTGQQ
eukprot:1511665-Amphidinium_carterae.3